MHACGPGPANLRACPPACDPAALGASCPGASLWTANDTPSRLPASTLQHALLLPVLTVLYKLTLPTPPVGGAGAGQRGAGGTVPPAVPPARSCGAVTHHPGGAARGAPGMRARAWPPPTLHYLQPILSDVTYVCEIVLVRLASWCAGKTCSRTRRPGRQAINQGRYCWTPSHLTSICMASGPSARTVNMLLAVALHTVALRAMPTRAEQPPRQGVAPVALGGPCGAVRQWALGPPAAPPAARRHQRGGAARHARPRPGPPLRQRHREGHGREGGRAPQNRHHHGHIK